MLIATVSINKKLDQALEPGARMAFPVTFALSRVGIDVVDEVSVIFS